MERGVNNVGPMAVTAIRALAALGVRAAEAVARLPAQVTADDLEGANRVVALKKEEHLPLLEERFPAWADKVEFWQVDDAPEALALIEREVLDGVEIKMLMDGQELPAKPVPAKSDDGVQQVIKPDLQPGRAKGGERPATA